MKKKVIDFWSSVALLEKPAWGEFYKKEKKGESKFFWLGVATAYSALRLLQNLPKPHPKKRGKK